MHCWMLHLLITTSKPTFIIWIFYNQIRFKFLTFNVHDSVNDYLLLSVSSVSVSLDWYFFVYFCNSDHFWYHLNPFKIIESISIHLNLFESIWFNSITFESIWFQLKPFDFIWIHLNTFDFIWIHLVSLKILNPFGKIGIHFDTRALSLDLCI